MAQQFDTQGEQQLRQQPPMPVTRLNRGLLIVGIVAIPSALANAFISGAFFVLFTCFDTCLNVGDALTHGQFTALTALLVPFLFLAPAVTLIVICWIWELIELRRWHATQVLWVVWLAPLLTLLGMVSVTLLTSLTSSTSLMVTGITVWYGTLALAIWPTVIVLVAGFWKQTAPRSPAAS